MRKLSVGDYGCRFNNGYEPKVYFERKSLADLTGTLTSGIYRFKKELDRAKDLGFQLILIIECSLTEAQDGTEYSQVDPLQIIKTVFTLYVKYGLFPVWCKNREEMALWICEYYSAIGRNAVKEFGSKWSKYAPPEVSTSTDSKSSTLNTNAEGVKPTKESNESKAS